MFDRKNILKHIKIFLTLLIFHFIFTTFIRFQLGVDLKINFLNSNIINLWKDIYLLFIYILVGGYLWKSGNIRNQWNKYYIKYPLIIIILMTIRGIFISLIHNIGLSQIAIGIKYDIWILLPTIAIGAIDWDKKDLKNMFRYFVGLIKTVIVLSIIWEIIRTLDFHILHLLGYGEIGDFAANMKPPAYFETGDNGIRRLSGIFEGPNKLSFYLISFSPILFFSWKYKQNVKIWWVILAISLIILTLSRSGWIALLGEIILVYMYFFHLNRTYFKKIIWKTILIGGLFLILAGIGLFATGAYKQVIMRNSSSKGHAENLIKAGNMIKGNILGYGLGTAGPAAHYVKDATIPESWWIQLVVEMGIVGFLLWTSFILILLHRLYFLVKKGTKDRIYVFRIGLIIGILGLGAQGLVLHSFESSIISFSLFIIIGFAIANSKQTPNLSLE